MGAATRRRRPEREPEAPRRNARPTDRPLADPPQAAKDAEADEERRADEELEQLEAQGRVAVLQQLRREQSKAAPGGGPGGPAERRPATPPASGDSDDSEDDDDEGGDGLAGLLDWRAKGTAAR